MAFPVNPSSPTPTSNASILTGATNNEATTVPIGTPIYSDSNGTFKRALGDGSAKATVTGVVLGDTLAGSTGSWLSTGIVTATTTQWDALAGTTGGLSSGITYYLHPTLPGRYTTVSTSNVPVLRGISATQASVILGTGVAGITVSTEVAATGMVAGGVTDNTAAVLSAITGAQSSGKRLVLPSGTYKLSSAVAVPVGATRIRGDGTVFTFDSTANHAFALPSGTTGFQIEGVSFQGANNDTYAANFWNAIHMADNCVDVSISRCYFNQCIPVQADDSITSSRLSLTNCYIHNAPNGVHPPSDSVIDGNSFICDTVIGTRAQAIYSFGSQNNLVITNNNFRNIAAEDIQIRASSPRFNQRTNFRIEGNNFENSNLYSIWVGSDDHPDIGGFVINGNTFRNCVSPIQALGARSCVITNNIITFDWEFPYTPGGTATAINASGAPGLAGHWNNMQGCIVADNQLIIRHPWVGKVTVTTQPSTGDTVTVGNFTYTWRASATVEGDLQIGANVGISADNFLQALQGKDGLMTAPNNVLRYINDAFDNPFAASYGETNVNLVVIASYGNFTLSRTGTALTIGAPVDIRQACPNAINVLTAIAPLVHDNHISNFYKGLILTQNLAPTVHDNVFVDNGDNGHGYGTMPPVVASGNIWSKYRGNRVIQQNSIGDGGGSHASIADFMPVIEDDYIVPQQFTTASLLGRSGVSPVGDGKAYTYLFYGLEQTTTIDPSTRPWRWDDGDEVSLRPGSIDFHYQRTSPGANQFNSADSLITLINATGTFHAAYETYQNDFGASAPKLLIRINAVTAGTAGNAAKVIMTRYKSPADWAVTATSATVQQPLSNGWTMMNKPNGDTWGMLYGGAATKVSTFVYTPLANQNRLPFVQGIDSTSRALAPFVDQANIIPGVGFYITHSVAAGTESFFWRL